MGEKSYFVDIRGSKGCRLRIFIDVVKGTVRDLVVQLERWDGKKWLAVARYDCAHGGLHIDIIHRDGSKEKHFLNERNLNDAVTKAIDDLKANWMNYLTRSGYGEE